MAQCYNGHTTATPLWREVDEGKTVWNACGLYFKLHSSARPISMKSDVIRKRSRHNARCVGVGVFETPSASPGASRRPTFNADGSLTLAPDPTTMGYGGIGDAYNYAMLVSESLDVDSTDSHRNKYRRMSSGSAMDPPSSAISHSFLGDEFSSSNTSASSSSQHNSMDFPFANYSYGIMHSAGSAFWHPLMLSRDDANSRSVTYCHPPMLQPEVSVSALPELHRPILSSDWSNGSGGNNGYRA